MTAPQLSVVIPTLDEAQALPRLLQALQPQRDVELEVIVADGGSRDATMALARAAGATAIAAPRGRGAQMNAGARLARGEWLLFLHADSLPTSPRQLADAIAALQAAGAPQVAVAGHFPLRFERSLPGHDRLYAYLEGKSRLSRPYTINGDQGLLIARRWFEALGGFDESLPYLEDQRLAARIFAAGSWLLLPGELLTSARRFEREGHEARYTLMALIMGMHAAGVEAFFARARDAYAVQDQAATLDLAPFAALVRRILWEQRWRGSARILWRVGRFIRHNAWQLAYRADLGRARPRWLPLFDRRIAPLLDHGFFDGLAALLACAWFFAILPVRNAWLRRSSAPR